MLRKLIVVVASTLLMSSNVHAALLANISGTVMVNKGEGFWEVSGPTVVNAGDRILVRGKGGAQIDYGNGCIVKVSANQSLVVSSASACEEKALYTASSGGSLKDPPGAIPVESVADNRVLVVGGLVVAAGAATVIAVGGRDNDKPASP